VNHSQTAFGNREECRELQSLAKIMLETQERHSRRGTPQPEKVLPLNTAMPPMSVLPIGGIEAVMP